MPAMIFAFVVLITVSSLSYLVRYNLLSIKSLQSQEIASTVEQQYIQEISQKCTIATGDISFGSYHIQNTLQSSQPIFSNRNVTINLYDSQPAAISMDIEHKLFYRNKLMLNKEILYKKLPHHSMINYDSSLVPINVPYIDVARMNNSQKFYRLNSSGHISDTERGYIGFLKKEYDWLLISVNKNIQIINLKNLDLSENYSLKIGWQLSEGSWQMLLAIYDKQHLYIFKTKLTNLVNNLSKAVLDLSTPIKVTDIPKDIVTLDWYYQSDESTPSLVVLSTRKDNAGNINVIIQDVEYDLSNNRYIISIKDIIDARAEISDKNIYVQVLDPTRTLAKSFLYLFIGNKLVVYGLGNSFDTSKKQVNLDRVVENAPIIVRKDQYSNYILVYKGDHYYQYLYTINTKLINVSNPVVYPKQKIQSIIVKYGLKFIVTSSKVYIENFNNQPIETIQI
ncbi:putative pilus assembly protein [Francisella philomiragia]|uniref:Putative pilus assembly protein n=2 Tax=Francisella philomiragia TaxID=28110 RepID=A0A0B6D6G6_9GAMM|nr:putative pilus assembly protein [Francisella philomiragia]